MRKAQSGSLGNDRGTLFQEDESWDLSQSGTTLFHGRWALMIYDAASGILDRGSGWRCSLGLSTKDIGQIGGGKPSQTDRIDVAVIQSLIRKGEVKDLVAEYGQVIVDERHHVSAFSFERVLRKVKAKYVAGLTATPVRKDGHHPIILMQRVPIRFNVSSKKQATSSGIQHEVIPRLTEFTAPPEWSGIGIQDIYGAW